MPKVKNALPPSRDAAVVRGYLKGELKAPGYSKNKKGNFASEGTTDVRKEAKKLGVSLKNTKRALKQVSDAGVAFEHSETVGYRMRDPKTAAKSAAKARAENRGRK